MRKRIINIHIEAEENTFITAKKNKGYTINGYIRALIRNEMEKAESQEADHTMTAAQAQAVSLKALYAEGHHGIPQLHDSWEAKITAIKKEAEEHPEEFDLDETEEDGDPGQGTDQM